MRRPKSQSNHLSVIAFICLVCALFLQGCDRGPCGLELDHPSCQAWVPKPGIYTVDYLDLEGRPQTVQQDAVGGLVVVCDCRQIIGDPTQDSLLNADLSIGMAASPDVVGVGDNLTYNIVVGNNGPSDAGDGAVLIDTLPPELSFVSIASSKGTCTYSASSRDVTCEIDPLRPGTDAEITLITEVTFAPLEAESKNSASLSLKIGDVSDPNPNNNRATTTTAISPILVTVSDSPDPVNLGSDLRYTITLTNNSQTSIFGLEFIDRLPASVNFVSGLVGSCNLNADTITCSDIAIVGGASVAYQFVVRPTTTGTITNTLSMPGRAGITTTTTVNPASGADLAITMSDSPDPDNAQNLTYTITVTNNGPDRATGVALVDVLPPGVDPFSNSSECSLSHRVLTCGWPSLANQQASTINLVVTPTIAGTITNKAFVGGDQFDPDEANNVATASTTVVQPALTADVSVAISDSPDPVVIKEPLTYNMTITNNGLASATNIVLTDTLPAGVTFAGHQDCRISSNIVTCDIADLPNGATTVLPLVVTPLTAGTINNTVSVTALASDPDISNNTATESTVVSESATGADLSVTISHTPDPVAINQRLTYNVAVTNHGLATATDVVLTHTLSSGWTNLIPSACRVTGTMVTCAIGDIPNGVTTVFPIFVVPATTGTITNTVTVHAVEDDPDVTNNTATDSTTVIEAAPDADVSLTISDSPDPVVVNQPLTYNVTIRNNGIAVATDALLTDILPPGVTFVPPFECHLIGNTIFCPLGDLPNGSVITMPLVFIPTVPGTISNTVNVTAVEADPDTTNNTATETTTASEPTSPADLSLTISDSPDPVPVNDQLNYAITITNNGPAVATGITLTDTLPSGVSFVPNPDCQLTGSNTVICNRASLASSASATFTIGVTPTSAGTITNAVRVTAVEPDPNTTNNTVIETTTVESQPADLSITASDAPDPVVVNQQLVYHVTVSNHGPSTATNMTVTDTLPAGVSFTPNADCHQVGNTVTCGTSSLANGATATFAIAVTPTSVGTITNTVSVAALEPDTNIANNTVTETTIVEPPPAADLSVTISASPDPVFADEQLTYSITVTNNGPDMATGITVTDTLPSNVRFLANPDCQLLGNTVTCTPVSLTSGASTTFTIVVTPTIEGTVTNTVSVVGLVNDPNLANNTVTAITGVLPSAGLVVTITDSPDPVGFNRALTYTVTVTNNGPSTATGVVLTNLVPPLEINDSNIVLSQGTFNFARQDDTITCNLGTLPSGASATLTVRGFTFTHGAITWTASVTANEHDPNPANNTAAENTTVN